MGFSIMLNLLKEKEKGKLVFVKLGTFYVATGEDAVLLHNKLGLKCTCFKLNMCIKIMRIKSYWEKTQ